ncbi:cyclin-dependent kinase inhibitor 5-like [Hordeum vulgare]|nr:cyclin-dependent kinase inhibitor 5-like [Hordeum vulgare]
MSEEAAAADDEMHADDAAVEAADPLPHEIFKLELEMQEPSESVERLEEFLLARDEVKKSLSVEESVVEYQRELWRRHYLISPPTVALCFGCVGTGVASPEALRRNLVPILFDAQASDIAGLFDGKPEDKEGMEAFEGLMHFHQLKRDRREQLEEVCVASGHHAALEAWAGHPGGSSTMPNCVSSGVSYGGFADEDNHRVRTSNDRFGSLELNQYRRPMLEASVDPAIDLSAAKEVGARGRRRHATSETMSTPGSATRASNPSRRRPQTPVCRYVPSSLEMDEFFTATEQHQHQTFSDKYNFCPASERPLPDRFEWTTLDS